MIDLFTKSARPPIVAILRGIQPTEILAVTEALLEAGIDALEVPLNSPDPMKSIKLAVDRFGDDLPIGAGTVLSESEVTQLADIGARLVVSPNTDEIVIAAAARNGMIVLPGAMSPTEIFKARSAGATGAKLFPARGLGMAFIGDVKSVLPGDFPLIAVGGVDASNAREWIEAGVDGLGAGSSVYRPGDSADMVLKRAKALIRATTNSKVRSPDTE